VHRYWSQLKRGKYGAPPAAAAGGRPDAPGGHGLDPLGAGA
jgi:hypothetical protein